MSNRLADSMNPVDIKARAAAFIDGRIQISGVQFPMVGIQRQLVIACMGAFAAGEVARALSELVQEADIALAKANPEKGDVP